MDKLYSRRLVVTGLLLVPTAVLSACSQFESVSSPDIVKPLSPPNLGYLTFKFARTNQRAFTFATGESTLYLHKQGLNELPKTNIAGNIFHHQLTEDRGMRVNYQRHAVDKYTLELEIYDPEKFDKGSLVSRISLPHQIVKMDQANYLTVMWRDWQFMKGYWNNELFDNRGRNLSSTPT